MRKIFFIALALLTFVSCSKKSHDPDIIASINGLKVTKKDFRIAFKRYYYQTGQSIPVNPVTRKAVLDGQFNTYVLSTYAKDKGWAADAKSAYQKNLIQRKVLAYGYLRRMVLDTVRVTDKDTRQLFYRLNTRVRASHLFAKTREGIDSLYADLQQGDNFDSLAKRIFSNKYMATHGGDVGTFSANDMDIAFENAAYSLKVGQYSKPVKTANGYSIVRLTAKYSKPIMTENQYDNIKNSLKALEMKRKRELATRKNLSDIIHKLNINKAVIHQLWEKVKEQRNTFNETDYESPSLNLSISGLENKMISDVSGFSFSGKDFIQEAYYTPLADRQRIKHFYQFDNYVKGLVFRSYAVQTFKSSRYDDDPGVQKAIRETFYNYLSDRVDQSIQKSITVNPDTAKGYYDKNPQQYVSQLQLDLARIVVPSLNEGKSVMRQLQAGETFVEQLRNHTIKSEDLMTDGDLGYRPLASFGTMAVKLKDMQKGELAGPFKYVEGEYYIFKCLGRREGKHLSFKEAEPVVDKLVRQQMFKQKKAELIKSVKAEHSAYESLNKLNNIKITI